MALFHLTLILSNILLSQLTKEVSLKQDKQDRIHDRQLVPQMSTGKRIIALFAMTIPLVSIIILIIWTLKLRSDPSDLC